jgi:hypothetical protein
MGEIYAKEQDLKINNSTKTITEQKNKRFLKELN